MIKYKTLPENLKKSTKEYKDILKYTASSAIYGILNCFRPFIIIFFVTL